MALVPASSRGGGTFNGGTITAPLVIADPNNNDRPFQENFSLSGINDNIWTLHSTDGGGTDLVFVDDTGKFTVQDAAGNFTSITPTQLTVDPAASSGLTVDANGTKVSGKLGVYGTTPVLQPAAIADAAGGAVQDAQARTALNSLLAAVRAVGLIAT